MIYLNITVNPSSLQLTLWLISWNTKHEAECGMDLTVAFHNSQKYTLQLIFHLRKTEKHVSPYPFG